MGDETEKKPEDQKKEAPAAAPSPAEENSLAKFQKWAEGLKGTAKDSAMAVYDAAKKVNAKIDFNENGTPDLTEAVHVIQEKGGDLVEGAVKGAKDLKDKSLAVWEQKGPQVGKFMGDNMFGLMGGAIGALLMMLLFETGPIAALLIGALLFSAISAMGGDSQNGLLSGLLNKESDDKTKQTDKGHAKDKGDDDHAKDVTAKEKDKEVTVKLLDKDGKLIKAREDGTQVLEFNVDTHYGESAQSVMTDVLRAGQEQGRISREFRDKVTAAMNDPNQRKKIEETFEKADPQGLLVGKVVEERNGKKAFEVTEVIMTDTGLTPGKDIQSLTQLSSESREKMKGWRLPLNAKGEIEMPELSLIKDSAKISVKLISDIPDDVKMELARQKAQPEVLPEGARLATKLDAKHEDHEKSQPVPKVVSAQVLQKGP